MYGPFGRNNTGAAAAMFAQLRAAHLDQIARTEAQRKETYLGPVEELQEQLAEIEKDFRLFFPELTIEGTWAKAAFEKIQVHINEARRLAGNTKSNVEALVGGQGQY